VGRVERTVADPDSMVVRPSTHIPRPRPLSVPALAPVLPARRVPRAAQVPTWIVSGEHAVQVSPAHLVGIPTGSRVRMTWGASPVPGVVPLGDSTLATDRRTPRLVPATIHRVTIALVAVGGAHPDPLQTADDVAAVVQGPVSRFWAEQTGGRVRFTVSRAAGWFTTAQSCDDAFGLWHSVARRLGFVSRQGEHLLLYLAAPPSATSCFTGYATVGTDARSGGQLWVRGTQPSLIAHELGHNLGLSHSDALTCNGRTDSRERRDGSWSDTCWIVPYGDWYDVMGISWDHLGSLSTLQSQRLGTLPATAIRTVTTPTTLVLAPVSAARGIRSLHVREPGGPTYVLEYRAPVGRDYWLAENWAQLEPGVIIRRTCVNAPDRSLVLDASPLGHANASGDRDLPLRAGNSLVTASGRLRIAVTSLSAGGATVVVTARGARPRSGVARR
jgi:hypothetical protein